MAKPVSFSAISMIEWKVKNIFSARGQESEKFGFQTSWWKLVLWKGRMRHPTKAIGLSITTEHAEEPFRDFKSRVFIVDKNQTPQFLTEKFCNGAEGRPYECVWQWDINKLREREDILSVDGAVSFVCILMVKASSEEDDKEEKSSVPAFINTKAGGGVEAHLLDFRRLLDDGALSDVTVKCGDRTIPAHRVILSARSEVFAAMLRNDMAESRSGVIEVADMDPPVLDLLLQYIYSCKLSHMTMDTAAQLYEAADKYGVVSLMKDCAAFMTENLTGENASRILLLADAHNDSDLKASVMAFIFKTLFKHNDIWSMLRGAHPKLTN